MITIYGAHKRKSAHKMPPSRICVVRKVSIRPYRADYNMSQFPGAGEFLLSPDRGSDSSGLAHKLGSFLDSPV